MPISDCPLEVFKLKDLQEMIVKETNRYARGDEKYEQWKEIDENKGDLVFLWGYHSYGVTISGRLLE